MLVSLVRREAKRTTSLETSGEVGKAIRRFYLARLTPRPSTREGSAGQHWRVASHRGFPRRLDAFAADFESRMATHRTHVEVRFDVEEGTLPFPCFSTLSRKKGPTGA